MGSLRAMWLQCGITCVLACMFFLIFRDEPNPKVPMLAAMIGGFGGTWVLMKLYVLVRYGWRAMRSMRMYGND